MIIKTCKYLLRVLFILGLTLCFNSVNAQSTTLIQDPKFEQLLNEKRKYNSGIVAINAYRFQIFSGTNEEAKKSLITFKKEYKTFDGTIIFNTPNYKVIIGNFKTRIETERNMNLIKKSYPNVVLMKPNRQ